MARGRPTRTSLLNESLPPFPYGSIGPAQAAGDTTVSFAVSRPQHHLAATDERMREPARVGRALKLRAFILGQRERGFRTAGNHAAHK